MLEKEIEKAFCLKVKQLGGLCEKFTSTAKAHVPDRLVTLPQGRIIFVELKRPNAKPREAQLLDHEKRRALGCDVRVIDNLEQVARFPDA
jgi:hypothetical protein